MPCRNFLSMVYVLIVAINVVMIPNAVASRDDTQQPITIEADRAELDEKKETSLYLGNVILQQGGIHIKADRINVYARKGELQRITAEGNPVRFTQQRESQEEIRGSSQNMEYIAESRQIILLNNAELWQGQNRFTGERIQFDPEKEKVIATGAPAEEGKSSQRVQITIQPKSSNKNLQTRP